MDGFSRRHQWGRVCTIFAAVCVAMLSGQLALTQSSRSIGNVADPELANIKLQDLAREAVDQPVVGSKRISISNGVLTYDFSPTMQSVFGVGPGRLTQALEILTRVEVLRRDFPAVVGGKPFWTKPLSDLEALTASMVVSAYKTDSDDKWSAEEQDYQARADKEFENIESLLLDYADRSKLEPHGTIGERGPAPGFTVTIVIDPPNTRVRYMPFLEYRRCILFGIPLESEWIDLNQGITQMIGRYRFRAEWPASLNGPEEGIWDVTRDSQITIHANSK